jgi:hypothetical protein
LKLQCEQLIDIANDNGLTQIVDRPTYRNMSILDLLFTTTPGLTEKVLIAPGISDNDHDLVQVTTHFKAKITKKPARSVYTYSNQH